MMVFFFFFSSRRRHTRWNCDWSSDVCSSDLGPGEQTGGGSGTAVTLLGAGGAIAGNEIEKNVKKRYAYRVTVRMDDGSFRTISLSSPPTLAVGDKVRVVEGKLVRT